MATEASSVGSFVNETLLELPGLGVNECILLEEVDKATGYFNGVYQEWEFYGIDDVRTTRLSYDVATGKFYRSSIEVVACAASNAAAGDTTTNVYLYPYYIYQTDGTPRISNTNILATEPVVVSCGQNQEIITKTDPNETWTRNQSIFTNEKRTKYSNVFQNLTSDESTYYTVGTMWAMLDDLHAIVKSVQSLTYTKRQYDIQRSPRIIQDMTIGSYVPNLRIDNGQFAAVDISGNFCDINSNKKESDAICDFNYVFASSNRETYPTKTGRYVSPVTVENSFKRSYTDYIRALVNPQTAKIVPTFGVIGFGEQKYSNTAIVEYANNSVYTWDTATFNEVESGGSAEDFDVPAAYPYPISNKYKIHARIYRLLLTESRVTTGHDFRIAVPYTTVLTLCPREPMPSPNYIYDNFTGAVYNRGGNFPSPVHTLPFPDLTLVYQNGGAFLARNARTTEEFFSPTNSFYQQGTITEISGAVYPNISTRILEGTNDDQMILRTTGYRWINRDPEPWEEPDDGNIEFYYEIWKGGDVTTATMIERGSMTKIYQTEEWEPNPGGDPDYFVYMQSYEKTITLPATAKGGSRNEYYYVFNTKLAEDPYPTLIGTRYRWSYETESDVDSVSFALSAKYKNIPAYPYDVPGQVIWDNAGNAHTFGGVGGKIFDLTKYRESLPQNIELTISDVTTEVTASKQKYLSFKLAVSVTNWGNRWRDSVKVVNSTFYIVVRRRSDGRFLQNGIFDNYDQRSTWTDYAGVWGVTPRMLQSQWYVEPDATTTTKPLLYGMATSPNDTYDVEVVFFGLHENIYKNSIADWNEIKVSKRFTFSDPN